MLDFLFAQEGVDLHIQDNEGWTPFHAAVCWGQKEAMKMLAEKGANMDSKDLHGDTAYGMVLSRVLSRCKLQLTSSFYLLACTFVINVCTRVETK